MTPPDSTAARRRVVVEGVTPEVDAGRFAIKRSVGETVVVEADVFADGHDELGCVVRWRPEDAGAGGEWREVRMDPLGNDRWRAAFRVTELGGYRYTVEGWIDRFATWRRDVRTWLEAGRDVSSELVVGTRLLREAAKRAAGEDRAQLGAWADRLGDAPSTIAPASRRRAGSGVDAHPALDPGLAGLVSAYPDRRRATRYHRELHVVVDRPKARFSAWYELFPRSWSTEPGRHGTFKDVIAQLEYVARLGFDVLYLPPIHPIGVTHRKGRNNAPRGGADDVGSPWAIGSAEGGHTAVHPDLGTIEDFDALVSAAAELGIEVALDVAFQTSPDHPWPHEHPEWFRKLPDGTIRYAENPPKRYEDIYPIDFETEDWKALWDELRGVFTFWIGHGVRIFRVDNPHTKAFAFWEWLTGELRRDHPDVILLSEAFTRPRIMYRLAKVGFHQSYTYFAWREHRWELEQYFTELTQTPVREYFRPSLWPNTPDILTEYLQRGGPPAFRARLVLAATLGASYGIYGPAFELCENEPREPGSEEYLHSEKYEIRSITPAHPGASHPSRRDLDDPGSLAPLIARVNQIRRENPALQHDWSLRFRHVDNDRLIAYTKEHEGNLVLVVVNLDPRWSQSGWLELPETDAGVTPDGSFVAHDLLTDVRYAWQGARNFVLLEPGQSHVFRIERAADG